MRKIFVFWIIFLIVLAVGIILAVSSKSTLKKEEKRAAELRKAVISQPSRLPKQPVASEDKTKAAGEVPEEAAETAPAAAEPASTTPSSSGESAVGSSEGGEIPPLENNIPVQINTNSLEITVPHSASQDDPVKQNEEPQPSEPSPAREPETNQAPLPVQ